MRESWRKPEFGQICKLTQNRVAELWVDQSFSTRYMVTPRGGRETEAEAEEEDHLSIPFSAPLLRFRRNHLAGFVLVRRRWVAARHPLSYESLPGVSSIKLNFLRKCRDFREKTVANGLFMQFCTIIQSFMLI